jgi:hypothetical protein
MSAPFRKQAVFDHLLGLSGSEKIVDDECGEKLVFRYHDKELLEMLMLHFEPYIAGGAKWYRAADIYHGQGYHTELLISEDMQWYKILRHG